MLSTEELERFEYQIINIASNHLQYMRADLKKIKNQMCYMKDIKLRLHRQIQRYQCHLSPDNLRIKNLQPQDSRPLNTFVDIQF